jgi:hypothetical protein
MIEILPPLEKYKYDTWRILPMKCYIDNSVRMWSCIQNVNTAAVVVVVAVAGGIVAVGILGDCPNSAAVAIDATDPQVGYTPCRTWEEHR